MRKRVKIISILQIDIKQLNSLLSYDFTVSSKITDNAINDIIIIDTYHPHLSAMIEFVPKFTNSFFFPIKKLENIIKSNPEIFLQELTKDQTIHTKNWRFFNETFLPTEYGDFMLFGFQHRIDGKRVLGLRTKVIPKKPFIRTHSMCYTGDIFHSKRCDCREELEKAITIINAKGGILLYPEEEGRGIGILNKLTIYNSQQIDGYDTLEAQYINDFPNDLRNYDYLKYIFRYFNVTQLNLITNNPLKTIAVEIAGVKLIKTIKIKSTITNYNREYLLTKMKKSGHNFKQEFKGRH